MIDKFRFQTHQIQDRREAREAERASEKEKIAATSGPSNREIETASINALLTANNLKMKEVAADGNCLYRYIYCH